MFYSSQELSEKLANDDFEAKLQWLYGSAAAEQPKRYGAAVKKQLEAFGEGSGIALFSAPGRSEIGGNHTDHQHGRVLAAAVTMDLLAAVSKTSKNEIRILSEGYPLCTVSLESLEPIKSEENSSSALIRGVAAGFSQRGYSIGGFDATMSSQVPKGSGLSSSAAYEVMVGTILSKLYNEGKVSPVEIAQIGQYAENKYFGKPCGLMDQTASSVGGFVAIDFKDPKEPIVKQVKCDLAALGYTICIVNAGGSHANLTSEYAAIPAEMCSVAKLFGKSVLREVDYDEFMRELPKLRGKVSDRALLRAIHFFEENDRAALQAEALESGDLKRFLSLIGQSGESSEKLLQNVYPANGGGERSVSLALVLSRQILEGKGVWRVHGGGFAGTIQAFVPNSMVDEYQDKMEQIFGAGSCYKLSVRPVGGYALEEK
ncbi:MAG: galactokinase family protein [Angelakisella sp.]